MKSRIMAKPAIVLMSISLLLLAFFEGFWLLKEYESQKEILNKEQSDHFHSSIRLIEDSLFNVMALKPFQIEVDSAYTITAPEGRRVLFESQDQGRFVTFVRSIDINQASSGSRSQSNNGQPRGRRSIMLGALSLRLSEGQDSAQVSKNLLSMMSTKLSQNNEAAPGLAYELVSWNSNMPYDQLLEERPDLNSGMMSAPYYDAWSQQGFATVYPSYNGYLLRRISLQILFAVVLFSCIAGAFYLVFHNLQRERKLSEIRNDFISNITHELKTPISTVRVALEALTNFNAAGNTERAREYVEISQAEIDRLTLLVDKVLQMSKLDEGEADLKIEHFDLREVISQTLSTLKVQFNRKSADVSFETQGQEFTVDADRLHITGVLYNLIDNALKYGGDTPQINISLVQDNGEVTVDVADNGQGVPQGFKNKVFDKFFRVPTGDRHNIKGHGLGLSYVAEVVRQHNGRIGVTDTDGGGATFSFTIPKVHVN